MIPRGEQWQEIAGQAGGDLSVTSYAVLLAAVARSGRTGVLRLSRRVVEKRVFLAEGRPVECRSNLAHETFGRFLRNEGRLTDREYSGALSDSLARGVPLGEVLIERELLSPHEIYRFLQKNLARKLLDGFTWAEGDFEIEEDEGGADPTVRINALQLLLTGVSKLTPAAEIDAGLAGLGDAPLVLDDRPVLAGTRVRLTSTAQRIARSLEPGPRTLDEIRSSSGLAVEDADRALYALALVGLVRAQSDRSVRPAVGPAPGLTAAPEELEAAAVPESTEAAEPAQPADPGDPADPADPAEAPAEVAAAPELESQAPPSTEAPSPTPDGDQTLLLRQAIIVESYLSSNRKDSFELLELEEGTTVEEIDEAFLRAAETFAPWSLDSTGAGDFGEQAQILFLRAAQAYAELRNSETRGALVHRRKVLRDEAAAREKPKFAIETDLLDSEEQFKKGLALVESGDLRKALELLEFAADCDPQEALYRAELAYRRDQFDSHRYRKQSIADLREAVRIDPGCGLALYYLGLVLADQGDLGAAEQALRGSIKPMAPDRRPIEALKDLTTRKRR